VKAAYKYQAEDVDELNFEVGEIIQVVEYDDPDEQVSIDLHQPELFLIIVIKSGQHLITVIIVSVTLDQSDKSAQPST
jgi:hypothetical protein